MMRENYRWLHWRVCWRQCLVLIATVGFSGSCITSLAAADEQADAAEQNVVVDTRQPSPANILLICVDDLRPELGCYGVDYISSPAIDALARRGRRFTHHYVQSPTCGASRYALLTGRYGAADNHALFARAKLAAAEPHSVSATMPEWFRNHGYTTVAVGKVSHHPGGLGGDDWDDRSIVELPGAWDRQPLPTGPWQHPRGAMHGLANGEIRTRVGAMDVFQSAEGHDGILYPDDLILQQSLEELERLAVTDEKGQPQPFFLAVGFIRPHLPFGAPARFMEPYRDIDLPPIPHPEKPIGKTTWHSSGEFMKYHRWQRDPNVDHAFADQVRKHYAACVSYTDALIGRLIERLDSLGLRDDTMIVLWGDHGWHLGEHAIWGKHSLFEESLRAPLIISYSGIPEPGIACEGIVESVDLFPTLCQLAGLSQPDYCIGTSLVAAINAPDAHIKSGAVSYFGNRQTLRTATHRLIRHADGYTELYDHTTPAAETKNIAAQHPDMVNSLTSQLRQRLADN